MKNGIYKQVFPGIRHVVIELIISLDKVLADIESSRRTISGEKSEFLKDGVRMVACVYGWAERIPDKVKVNKIVNWKLCKSDTKAKGLLGIFLYYRRWIKNLYYMYRPNLLTNLGKEGEGFSLGT